jgi:Gram-negative bacterial TonB protein C-terminal
MTDQKRCVRCERLIDASARLCPFCNWDQSEPIPAAVPESDSAPVYTAPREHRIRKYVFSGVGLAVLLVVSFALGSMIHGANPEETAAKTGGSIVSTTAAPEPKEPPSSGRQQAKVQLVPVNESAPQVEQPITSAPVPNAQQGVPDEYQRSDATAVSSAEYQQLAARAKAQKQSALIDPRSLTASPYVARKPKPAPVVTDVARTPPEPIDDRLPEIHVSQNTTVRLNLSIGADGRVHEVELDGVIPGQSARLIAAVQSWRFRPATVNGTPVEAPYSMTVSFHVDE